VHVEGLTAKERSSREGLDESRLALHQRYERAPNSKPICSMSEWSQKHRFSFSHSWLIQCVEKAEFRISRPNSTRHRPARHFYSHNVRRIRHAFVVVLIIINVFILFLPPLDSMSKPLFLLSSL
jgi:hypothetical protein